MPAYLDNPFSHPEKPVLTDPVQPVIPDAGEVVINGKVVIPADWHESYRATVISAIIGSQNILWREP